MTKPVAVIDLFSGMGGFTQGALDAGAFVVFCVDNWKEANAVHERNHPLIPVRNMELGTEMSALRICHDVAHWKDKGYHVHLHGSPPCQALSNASNARLRAAQGMGMILWYLDLVKSSQPDSWSMENVKPVARRLPDGTPWQILYAVDYDVPQSRERCFAGEGWEAVKTRDVYHKTRNPTGTQKPMTFIEALPHITLEIDEIVNKNVRKRTVNDPFRTITSRSASQTRLVKGGPEKIRSLTIEETMILQGFAHPYNMDDARTQGNRWAMIGNAVPPPMAEAVIRGIKHD
tara:strand:- start:468 stop:1334 length:867 start_codon:yes stop_codon:yes gene_type:complete